MNSPEGPVKELRVGTGPEAQAPGYPNEALTGWCVQPALSRLRLGSPGLESRVQ